MSLSEKIRVISRLQRNTARSTPKVEQLIPAGDIPLKLIPNEIPTILTLITGGLNSHTSWSSHQESNQNFDLVLSRYVPDGELISGQKHKIDLTKVHVHHAVDRREAVGGLDSEPDSKNLMIVLHYKWRPNNGKDGAYGVGMFRIEITSNHTVNIIATNKTDGETGYYWYPLLEGTFHLDLKNGIITNRIDTSNSVTTAHMHGIQNPIDLDKINDEDVQNLYQFFEQLTELAALHAHNHLLHSLTAIQLYKQI